MILNKIGELGIVPVVVIEDAAAAPKLAAALVAGGLPCAEITFRTAAAAAAMKKMATAYPDMLLGAGTVLSMEQAKTAVSSGAKFIVTPGFDPAVVDWCLANEIPITPGIMTPTDINQALAKGLSLLKFFPAEAAGGVKTLKAISSPYVGLKFMPTGGINPQNLADYLRLPSVHACGGSWLVSKQLLAARQFAEITRLAREAMALVQRVREERGE
ncbi:MAG: bifunctional 4-hydroxy-2-oxoglutarate aldolase/2-dehydro-3-deoxy-phosphogluconate aldolase [Chloroflexota bacterium]